MAQEISSSTMDMVRRFAGADPAETDTVLAMCYRAAVAWYEAAGVPEDEENDLYTFWACNLAAWMYDNRGNADPGAAVPVYIVTSVHQLRKRRVGTGTGSGTASGTGTGTETGNGTASGNGAGTGTGTETGSGTASGDGAGTGTGTETGSGTASGDGAGTGTGSGNGAGADGAQGTETDAVTGA